MAHTRTNVSVSGICPPAHESQITTKDISIIIDCVHCFKTSWHGFLGRYVRGMECRTCSELCTVHAGCAWAAMPADRRSALASCSQIIAFLTSLPPGQPYSFAGAMASVMDRKALNANGQAFPHNLKHSKTSPQIGHIQCLRAYTYQLRDTVAPQ